MGGDHWRRKCHLTKHLPYLRPLHNLQAREPLNSNKKECMGNLQDGEE